MTFQNNLYTIVSDTLIPEGRKKVYRIRLIPESIIFKAHFPGEPIMPGACIVQMVQELATDWIGSEMEIAKVSNLKFLNVISPDAILELNVALEVKKEEASQIHLKADLSEGCVDYTKMSLILNII